MVEIENEHNKSQKKRVKDDGEEMGLCSFCVNDSKRLQRLQRREKTSQEYDNFTIKYDRFSCWTATSHWLSCLTFKTRQNKALNARIWVSGCLVDRFMTSCGQWHAIFAFLFQSISHKLRRSDRATRVSNHTPRHYVVSNQQSIDNSYLDNRLLDFGMIEFLVALLPFANAVDVVDEKFKCKRGFIGKVSL